jgi:hypothetical protein
MLCGFKQQHGCNTVIDNKAQGEVRACLAEFSRGIAHHRAEGATEERIRQLLGASLWLVVQEVDDPALRAWLCEELTKAARLAPIVTNYPANWTLH